MKSESLWQQTCSLSPRESLQKNIDTDVAVIGGGICGILTAYFLKSHGLDVVVLEADRIGSGQTQGTTGKITSQHGAIYQKINNYYGFEKAKAYAEANQKAIIDYSSLIQKEKIDCDFEEKPAYLYSTIVGNSLEKEYEFTQKLGFASTLLSELPLPFPIESALCFPKQAQFHPLKFVDALQKNLTVYEHTQVMSVDKNCISTSHFQISAKHIVFACHYPFLNVPGYYFMRMHQERSYLLALQNAPALNGMYIGVDPGGYSFRNYQNYLLVGGASHRTGKKKSGKSYQKLHSAANSFFPNASSIASWSAQDCMPHDNIPYIGRFSQNTPNWYIATGFQKWGISTSMVAANLITDLILKRENPAFSVFKPNRFTAAEVPSLLKDSALAVKNLLPGLDSASRCTHLGCRLTWNEEEKTFDCPCHGSRFGEDKQVINGPALHPLK